MARASAALAAESGIPGVLLYGMPGGGKTACALELAYGHEHAFDRLVWFKSPDEGSAIDASLTDFTLTLERYLDGFQMVHLVSDSAKLAGFLPRLTELLERNRLLIVIDNAESLMTDGGEWRDSRWGQVVEALTAHNGLGRLLLTTRRVPSGLTALQKESVDTLTSGEALLLARQLPNLRPLPSGELADVLHAAGGHPKLLELANGQAANPEQLATLIEAGDAPSSSEDYPHLLATWTNTVTDTLTPGERDLFWLLCCLEEPDREYTALNVIWPRLWQRLDRSEQPVALDRELRAISASGLASIHGKSIGQDEFYVIHPALAATGRAHTGKDFRDAVDCTAASYWYTIFLHSSGEIEGEGLNTSLMVRGGLAAAPYLVRQHEWEIAGAMLDSAFNRNRSRANAIALLPLIQKIASHEPRAETTLALALSILDPSAAEAKLLSVIDNAVAHHDHRAASAGIGHLINIYRDNGRLVEALSLIQLKNDFTKQAGLGPWSQLGNEIQRLQILNEAGYSSQVINEVSRLWEYLGTLNDAAGVDESTKPWHIREDLLDSGRFAALQLGLFQEALNFNAAITASKINRHAPAREIASARFSDYGPLLRLGQPGSALSVLQDCLLVFSETRDVEMTGFTLTALAVVEDARGHGDSAIRFSRDALRYCYLAGNVIAIAAGYHNLGLYLCHHANKPDTAIASHLTAAIIRAFTGIDHVSTDPISSAALILRDIGSAARPLADVADLCRQLGDIPGTDPAALIARLSPDLKTAEQTLQDLITQAQTLAREATGEPD